MLKLSGIIRQSSSGHLHGQHLIHGRFSAVAVSAGAHDDDDEELAVSKSSAIGIGGDGATAVAEASTTVSALTLPVDTSYLEKRVAGCLMKKEKENPDNKLPRAAGKLITPDAEPKRAAPKVAICPDPVEVHTNTGASAAALAVAPPLMKTLQQPDDEKWVPTEVPSPSTEGGADDLMDVATETGYDPYGGNPEMLRVAQVPALITAEHNLCSKLTVKKEIDAGVLRCTKEEGKVKSEPFGKGKVKSQPQSMPLGALARPQAVGQISLDVKLLLERLSLCDFKQGLQDLGVVEVKDLLILQDDDLRQLGMTIVNVRYLQTEARASAL